ncbi:MAG: signal peptide peptidase SppA [Thermodesulfobacteriota bacterium]
MTKRSVLTGIILIIVLIGFFVAGLYGISRLLGGPFIPAGDKVGVVRITGVLIDSRPVLEQLNEFVEKRDVKALVIRINSPGGGVGAAQEIFRELEKITDKTVVASMGSVAASGGYYVALGTQRIFANPGTITGSIGVIMEFSTLEGLMRKIGLKSYTIKSGKYKDVGSPFRKMTAEDRELLQGVVGDIHNQFVEVVARRRDLPLEKAKKIADGRIFTGRQAKELGLIDELGNLQDAIDAAAKMAGIKGKPQVVYSKKLRFSLADFLLGERIVSLLERLSNETYQFSYRFIPPAQ